jgi:hypothetical protein
MVIVRMDTMSSRSRRGIRETRRGGGAVRARATGTAQSNWEVLVRGRHHAQASEEGRFKVDESALAYVRAVTSPKMQ